MCGLAGIISNNNYSKGELNEVTDLMLNPIKHRGPDSSGIWTDENLCLGLGHRRLSILDLSEHGSQPMQSATKRYVITYNGEIYNFKELKKEIEQTGHSKWRGESDTEVILAAVECWGLEKAISRFIGMFAFALWDNREKLLHLVRDRIGIKPLYWSIQNDNVIFASELKSLRECKLWDPDIDINSLSLFMKYKYIPCPATIYKNVNQVEPATIVTINKNRNIKKSKYWEIAKIAQIGIKNNRNIISEDDVIELINNSVKYRLVSDVPIGAFLSGGIDSSAVVALMQKNSMSPVNTFSIGFSINSYDESEYSRKVSEYLGTNHTEYILEPNDAFNIIPDLSSIYDEPFSDSSQIPTYLVSMITSKNVKVALSGDGGDEVFAGYNRYIYADRYFDTINKIPFSLQHILKKMIFSVSQKNWNKVFFHLPSKLSHSQGGDKLYKLANIMGKNEIEMYKKLVSDWQFEENVIKSDIRINDINYNDFSFFDKRHSVEYMQLMDQQYYLPNDILTKVDRASMANSLEVRVPLLDHRLIEKMWQLSRSQKINNNISKVILQKILGKHLPQINFNKNKTGFSLPISEWLRGPLREWAESLLNKDLINKQNLLNYEVINKKWSEHLSGANNWHEHIWSVLMFNAWYENWIERR